MDFEVSNTYKSRNSGSSERLSDDNAVKKKHKGRTNATEKPAKRNSEISEKSSDDKAGKKKHKGRTEATEQHAKKRASSLTAETGEGEQKVPGDQSEMFESEHKDAVERRDKDLEREVQKDKDKLVPVYLTLMVKKLREDADGGFQIIGTLLQRVREDLEQFTAEAEYFESRVNDGETFASDCFRLRKTKRQLGKDKRLLQTISTFDTNVPLIRYQLFNSYPFRISALHTVIELSSLRGNSDAKAVELRADILCHRMQRNLVSIRDPDNLDNLRRFDLVTEEPTVEIAITHKDAGRSAYASKLRLTWYITPAWADEVMASVVPAILLALLNYVNTTIFNDEENQVTYYENAAIIGLALIETLKSCISEDSYTNALHIGHVYGLMLLVGLMSAIVGGYYPMPVGKSFRTNVGCYLSNAFMFGSVLVPLVSYVRYVRLIRHIRSFHRDNSTTFLGVEGKHSDAEQEGGLHSFPTRKKLSDSTKSQVVSEAWSYDEGKKMFGIGCSLEEAQRRATFLHCFG